LNETEELVGLGNVYTQSTKRSEEKQRKILQRLLITSSTKSDNKHLSLKLLLGTAGLAI